MTTLKDTWISVKDAMPEFNDNVIVWDSKFKKHYYARWKLGYFYNEDGFVENITHWRILSKPKTTNQ